MELLPLVLYTTAVLILVVPSTIEGTITCYRCTVHPPGIGSINETKRLCSEFNNTQLFEVDCPYSTLCMKKTYELKIQNDKKIRIGIRDCAPQQTSYQVLRDNKWEMETKVDEQVYEEGCHQADNYGIKSSTAEYCYCHTNLCNGGKSTKDPSSSIQHTDTMAVIIIFNMMKYIRSLR